MAKVSINIIKDWFRNGLRPDENQFWNWLDSYWHKDEQLPITSIENIESFLDAKADKESFETHLTDVNAHANLLSKSKVYAFGEFQIFKANGNLQTILEVGDVAVGFLNDGTFIPFGKYSGGDIQDINNWDTSPMWLSEIINQT